jgi:ABC-2 type transport system ATP-binding protein
MIAFEALSKNYGEFHAVHPLSLQVRRGEVFGFLGPNGAGKTTTIRMMMGILVPSSGRVLIDQLDCHADATEVKRRVGYLPDTPVFYDYLRGREILQFVAEMHGYSRAEARARSACWRIRPAGSGRRLRRQLLAGHEKTAGTGLRADPRSGRADTR